MFLTNIASSSRYLKWFNHDWREIQAFTQKNNLAGVELIIHHDPPDFMAIPPNLVQGLHLTYWPVCLDFLRQDKKALLRQFGSVENIKTYYEGPTPQEMITHYRYELEVAQQLKVKYVVFHVSHVELSHIFQREFPYGDKEVLDAFSELLNEIFPREDLGFTLLCENLWWPGLNFLDPRETSRFIEGIKYPNKGFMLDIGHLMITNPDLNNGQGAVKYILDILHNLGEASEWIKGIHLNMALCGEYLLQNHQEKADQLAKIENIWDRLFFARDHILNMDLHVPFDHPAIRDVIDYLHPQFVVYEVEPRSLDEFTDFIVKQNLVLGR